MYIRDFIAKWQASSLKERSTSQDCSGCGERVAKELSERVHHCDLCGLELDRDHNAALNILSKGLGLIGTVGHTGTGHPRDAETPEERQAAA